MYTSESLTYLPTFANFVNIVLTALNKVLGSWDLTFLSGDGKPNNKSHCYTSRDKDSGDKEDGG